MRAHALASRSNCSCICSTIYNLYYSIEMCISRILDMVHILFIYTLLLRSRVAKAQRENEFTFLYVHIADGHGRQSSRLKAEEKEDTQQQLKRSKEKKRRRRAKTFYLTGMNTFGTYKQENLYAFGSM